MAKPTPLSPEDVAKIAVLYRDYGYGLQRLCETFHVGKARLTRILMENGVTSGWRRPANKSMRVLETLRERGEPLTMTELRGACRHEYLQQTQQAVSVLRKRGLIVQGPPKPRTCRAHGRTWVKQCTTWRPAQ